MKTYEISNMKKIETLKKISLIEDTEKRKLFLSKFLMEEIEYEEDPSDTTEEDLECEKYIRENLEEESREMLNFVRDNESSIVRERFFDKYDSVDFNTL